MGLFSSLKFGARTHVTLVDAAYNPRAKIIEIVTKRNDATTICELITALGLFVVLENRF